MRVLQILPVISAICCFVDVTVAQLPSSTSGPPVIDNPRLRQLDQLGTQFERIILDRLYPSSRMINSKLGASGLLSLDRSWLNPGQIISGLISTLKTSDDPVKIRKAIQFIGHVDLDDSAEIASLLANYAKDERYSEISLQALGRMKEATGQIPEVQNSLMHLLRQDQSEVRFQAFQTTMLLNIWTDEMKDWCTNRLRDFTSVKSEESEARMDLLIGMRLANNATTSRDAFRLLSDYLTDDSLSEFASLSMVMTWKNNDATREHFTEVVSTLDTDQRGKLEQGLAISAQLQNQGVVPWPLQPPYVDYKILTSDLWTPDTPLKSVCLDIETALRSKVVRCNRYKIFRIDDGGGIAIVTAREKIDRNGYPDYFKRWSRGVGSLNFLHRWLMSFTRKIGSYRIFIFVINDRAMPSMPDLEDYESVSMWFENRVLHNGVSDYAELDQSMQNLKLDDRTCNVYIYQFDEYEDDLLYIYESPHEALEHLTKVRLWEQFDNLKLIRMGYLTQ